MRCICKVCDRVVRENRSSHLRRKHGIPTDKGSVKDYFLTPAEAGLAEDYVNSLPEGSEVTIS